MQRKEQWEELKSEADLECYDWASSSSRKSVEQLFNKAHNDIPHALEYATAVDKLMNEGKSKYCSNCPIAFIIKVFLHVQMSHEEYFKKYVDTSVINSMTIFSTRVRFPVIPKTDTNFLISNRTPQFLLLS